MSTGGQAKKAKLSTKPAHVDAHDHIEKQRQALVVNDKNRMALKAKDKLREYIDKMSPGELNRYEHYRRSSFKPEIIMQLMQRTIKTTYGLTEFQYARPLVLSCASALTPVFFCFFCRYVKPIADAEYRRISIIMAGLTKMYMGDIIEESLRVMKKRGEKGPVHPHHVREVRVPRSHSFRPRYCALGQADHLSCFYLF